MATMYMSFVVCFLLVIKVFGQNPCNLPSETGRCKARLPSYYYDKNTGFCDCFIFGGCGGNKNRFSSLSACMSTCNVNPRSQPHSPETLAGNCFLTPSSSNLSPSFEALKPSIQNSCDLPAVSGICKAYLPLYYYDKGSGTCKCFVYTGCGGNPNRFETLSACMSKCNVNSQSQPRNLEGDCPLENPIVPSTNIKPPFVPPRQNNACDLPFASGICKALLPSYYYNKISGTCKCFIYTGCNGNKNRFDKLSTCMSTCNVNSQLQSPSPETPGKECLINSPSEPLPSKAPSVNACDMPVASGNCRAYIPTIYYDKGSGTCKCFVYTGCGGNANRFETTSDCISQCNVSSQSTMIDCPAQPSPPTVGVTKVKNKRRIPSFFTAAVHKWQRERDDDDDDK